MLARLTGLSLVCLFIAAAALQVGPPMLFVHVPSALTVGFVSVGGLLLAQGGAGFRATVAALRGDATELEVARGHSFAASARSVVWLAGLLGLLMNVSALVSRIGDPASMGPLVAVFILPLVYAAALHLLLVVPLRARMQAPTMARVAG